MTPGPRRSLAPILSAFAGALLMLAQHAAAQEAAAKPATDLERAQKAADAVFERIRLNAEKGASRQPAAAPMPPARRPAPAPQAAPAPVAAAPKPPAASSMPPTASTPPVLTTPAIQAQASLDAPAPAASEADAFAAADPADDPVVVAAAVPTSAPSVPLATAMQASEPPPALEPEQPLQLVLKVEPVFPRQLIQQRLLRGFAQVQFTVAPDGTVSAAESVSSSHSRLASAAVDAVRQWRFAPIPTARLVSVEVAFNYIPD